MINPEGRSGATTSPRRRGYGVTQMSSAQHAFNVGMGQVAGQVARLGGAAVVGLTTLAATKNPGIAAGAATGFFFGSQEVQVATAPDGRKPGRPRGGTR